VPPKISTVIAVDADTPRKLFVIGIGPGDPEQVTVQAINALNAVDVVFVLEKEDEQRELVDLRREVCARYVSSDGARIVTAQDPPRDRGAATYREGVGDWRRARADVCESLIRDELSPGHAGAFLAWGDPALYDSVIGVLDDVLARGGVAFEYEVIPGISSVSALAARHRRVLNRVGGAVQVTTGRRLAEGFPDGVDDVVVMLDAEQAFAKIDDDGLEIAWGAYVGMPDEILIAGPLSEAKDEIVRVRAEARTRKGWMFDAYLLRRVKR
jgi:precorrin-6A synthase